MLCGNICWGLGLLSATASALVVHPYVLEARSNSTDSGYCELGAGVVDDTSSLDDRALEPELSLLEKRVLPPLQPLRNRHNFGGSQTEFMRFLQQRGESNSVPVRPEQTQLDTWRVDNIPISATADWFTFGNSRKYFKMSGLSGCTATVVVSQQGMWASHVWESETTPNRGGAFNERRHDGSVRERSLNTFKKIAVDILHQRTPNAELQNRRRWKSLEDMKTRYGNPLTSRPMVLIFTKAMSYNNAAPRYAPQIDQLRREYRHNLVQPDFKPIETYVGTDSQYPHNFPGDLMGVMGMQYGPCVRMSHGRCVARFEAFVEKKAQPVIVREWIYQE